MTLKEQNLELREHIDTLKEENKRLNNDLYYVIEEKPSLYGTVSKVNKVFYRDKYYRLLGENERLRAEVYNMGLTIKFLINPEILEYKEEKELINNQ